MFKLTTHEKHLAVAGAILYGFAAFMGRDFHWSHVIG